MHQHEKRAQQVLDLEAKVADVVTRLKERGLTSPYLRTFVVARINPIRFSKAITFDFDEVMQKMTTAAGKFNIERVKPDEVSRAAVPPFDED